MNRRFGWAMLVAAGMVLGCALSSYEKTSAAPSAEQNVEEQSGDVANQLRDIRNYVKEINTLLHSGSVKVVVLINPDAKP